jgi:hypothetical protein
MTWRREDYGYAAATLAAVLFVAYLIAGNFGLVPSPLGRNHADGLPQADVAALALATIRPVGPLPGVAIAPTGTGPQIPRGDETPLPAGPSVHIDTLSGSTVHLTDKATVGGHILAPADVKQVVVHFVSSSGNATSVASNNCTDPTMCAWSVAVPNTLGTYRVTAVGSDVLGRSASSNTITLTVVNPGNVIGSVSHGVTTTVQDGATLVQKVPSALTGALRDLLSALHL